MLTEADLERSKRNIPRWQNNVRFAIYQSLSKKGLMRSVGKGRWEITDKGKGALKMLGMAQRGIGKDVERLVGTKVRFP